MNYPKNGKSLDLNKLTILDDTTGLGVPLSDNSAMVDGAKVEVYFRNLEAKLIEENTSSSDGIWLCCMVNK